MDIIHDNLDQLLHIVRRANAAILEVYNAKDYSVTLKSDNSPLTEADLASNRILCGDLRKLFPDIPVISEENDEAENKAIIRRERFWLIDPLDGTKEFISRSGEFTVCVALIEKGKPVFGIVSAPVLNTTYYGGPELGSFRIQANDKPQPIHVASKKTGIVLGSRSFHEQQTEDYIAQHFNDTRIESVGSQLKFARIAEGAADAYPRLGTSMRLWDLAAGHAIIEGAGGTMTRPDGTPIDYNSPTLTAGDFVARR